VIHADLIWRHGGMDNPVAAFDSTPGDADAGTLPGIDQVVSAAAVPAQAGELLVVNVKIVSGTSDFIEFGTSLRIP
jgi:hypothetical protein